MHFPINYERTLHHRLNVAESCLDEEFLFICNLIVSSFLFKPKWTTDSDLVAIARKQGVKDIIEIRFAENRTNGQSRG